MNNENIIEIKDLKKTYEKGAIKALDGINLRNQKRRIHINYRAIRIRKINSFKYDRSPRQS